MATKSHQLVLTAFMIVLIAFYVIYSSGFFNMKQTTHLNFHENRGAMTSASSGRFGNNLLEYAALYALAKINKCNAYLSPQMANYLHSCFFAPMPINESLDQLAPWKTLQLDYLMKDEYRNLSCDKGRYIRFSGFPSDWRFFEDFDDDIRRQFMFSTMTKSTIYNFLNQSPGAFTYVGIHVRRTDYLKYLARQDCHLADEKYLKSAMKFMNDRHDHVLFVVASDDVEWCRQTMSKWDFKMTFVPQHFSPCLTMGVLAHCNHSIITQGTFGFWGAYLAHGETIYYTDYCHNFTDILRKFQGLHLADWIGISARDGKFRNSTDIVV